VGTGQRVMLCDKVIFSAVCREGRVRDVVKDGTKRSMSIGRRLISHVAKFVHEIDRNMPLGPLRVRECCFYNISTYN